MQTRFRPTGKWFPREGPGGARRLVHPSSPFSLGAERATSRARASPRQHRWPSICEGGHPRSLRPAAPSPRPVCLLGPWHPMSGGQNFLPRCFCLATGPRPPHLPGPASGQPVGSSEAEGPPEKAAGSPACPRGLPGPSLGSRCLAPRSGGAQQAAAPSRQSGPALYMFPFIWGQGKWDFFFPPLLYKTREAGF